MTSSLRNSIHRRNHKERSQLAHRAKLGILEKHADYVKRARDYHSKQDRLTRLKQKAADRNKDEFYFSMSKEKTKGGVHVKDRGNVALPTDIVKVLKTQDENYVRTMRAAGLKKIDKLKSQLMTLADLLRPGSTVEADENDDLDDEELRVLVDAGIISPSRKSRNPKHILFVDSEEAARNYQIPPASTSAANGKSQTTEAPDLGWKVAKGKKKSTSIDISMDDEDAAKPDSTLNRKRLLKELSARLTRDKQLRYAEREFEMQRLMMGKGGRKRLVGAENEKDDGSEDELDTRQSKQKVDEKTYRPRVYKWKLERKR